MNPWMGIKEINVNVRKWKTISSRWGLLESPFVGGTESLSSICHAVRGLCNQRPYVVRVFSPTTAVHYQISTNRYFVVV